MINFVFVAVYTFEALIKLIAMRKNYFRDSWNTFDFINIVGTLMVLIGGSILNTSAGTA